MQTKVERAAAFYAEQVKRTGTKVLRFFPTRKDPRAAPNQTRLEVLRRLVDDGSTIGLGDIRKLRELEALAVKAGYTLVEIDPSEQCRRER